MISKEEHVFPFCFLEVEMAHGFLNLICLHFSERHLTVSSKLISLNTSMSIQISIVDFFLDQIMIQRALLFYRSMNC